MAHRIEQATARGLISTRADYDRIRTEFGAEKQQRIAQSQLPVRDAITAMGGEIVAVYDNVWGLAARLTPTQIQRLAERPDVAFIDADQPGQNNEVTGIEVAEGSQLSQFTDASLSPVYDGENPGGSYDITFAMMEAGEPDDTHVGYEEGSGYTTSRFRAKYRCDNSSCWPVSSYTSPISHTSAVAGLRMGDLIDGQDSGVISTSERRRRSGYANEGRGYPFNITSNNTAGGTLALSNMQSLSVHPHVVNTSWGVPSYDGSCLGMSSFNAAANDLFENDTLPIVTAGNRKGSSTDCTIDAPASAIGVFTVGAHADTDTWFGDETDVRGAPIWSQISPTVKESAMGGVSYSEGRYRSIVDLTAFGCRSKMFDSGGSYTWQDCGTSYAAPTVTGAAMDFVDWYKNEVNDDIDNPGLLFANLLLMGDRQSQSGKLTSRFDSQWGAGRLKMRRYDDAGMDGPWSWGDGWTCVT